MQAQRDLVARALTSALSVYRSPQMEHIGPEWYSALTASAGNAWRSTNLPVRRGPTAPPPPPPAPAAPMPAPSATGDRDRLLLLRVSRFTGSGRGRTRPPRGGDPRLAIRGSPPRGAPGGGPSSPPPPEGRGRRGAAGAAAARPASWEYMGWLVRCRGASARLGSRLGGDRRRPYLSS